MITTIKSKIFQKTLAIIFIGFGIIATTCSGISGWILYDHLSEEYESKALAIGNSISTSLPELFLREDAATDQSIIDQYLNIKGVAYALVKTEKGDIIAHTFSPTIPEDILKIIDKNTPDLHPENGIIHPSLLQTKAYLDVCSPILMGKAGYVHIGMDMKLINSYLIDAIIKMQIILLGVFFACIIITFFLIRRIADPLTTLTQYANELAAQHFDAPIHITTDDEIGVLASTMQSMALRINDFIHSLETKIYDATAELRDTGLYLGIIVDNMADGLLVIDEKGTVLSYNPALLHIFGLLDADMRDIFLFDLLDQSAMLSLQEHGVLTYDSDFQTMNFNVLVQQGTPIRKEVYTSTPDNKYLCLEISMASTILKCGNQFILVMRDTTRRKEALKKLEALNNELEKIIRRRTRKLETANGLLKKEIITRKATEDALEGEKELFATTLRSINDGVITLDNKGMVLFINQAMVDLGGWSFREAIGKPFSSTFQVSLNNTQLVLNREKQDARSLMRLEKEQDALFQTKENHVRDIALRVLPLFDKQSETMGQVLIMRDITEFKRQEQEQLKSEKLESIGILAGGIAHDFNNILTAVLNYIILAMKNPHLEEKNHNQLEKARKAGLRAQQLTQQLLTFSKGGAPIIELTGINDLIKDSITFALRGSNVKTSITISQDIWNAEIDPGQIAQVIENLAINADQAMPKGGRIDVACKNIRIDKTSRLPVQPGQYIEITIKDQGDGISKAHLKKIFDPYFTTKKAGSGLGLATTYSIIKNHHGHISVTSEKHKGTTFTIYLPASPGQNISGPVTLCQTIPGQGTILLMDDDESIREVMEETLGFLGYTVLTTRDGVETIAKYQQYASPETPIDLVIMDLTIPGGMGGKEAVGKILEIDQDAKVVVSSGYSQDPVMADYESYGFIDILAKPYTLEEISKKISQILGRKSRHLPPGATQKSQTDINA